MIIKFCFDYLKEEKRNLEKNFFLQLDPLGACLMNKIILFLSKIHFNKTTFNIVSFYVTKAVDNCTRDCIFNKDSLFNGCGSHHDCINCVIKFITYKLWVQLDSGCLLRSMMITVNKKRLLKSQEGLIKRVNERSWMQTNLSY